MLSCNCLNVIIELEKNKIITKESLELTTEEKTDNFFMQEVWYVGKLVNISKVHPQLVVSRQVGLWTISKCINCDVQTHALHRDQGSSFVLVHSKLLNDEAIKNIKSSDLYSTIFRIVVNPNDIGPESIAEDTYHSKVVAKSLREISDVVNNVIRQEEATVEEKIKAYSDKLYEELNTLKDNAYKEREALVRIILNAAQEESSANTSPKSIKSFGNVSTDKQSPTAVSFSPKHLKTPKDVKPKETNYRDDFMFDFENDDYGSASEWIRNGNQPDDSDSEEVEEAEEATDDVVGINISQGRTRTTSSSIAKSCPVDIPVFAQSSGFRNNRSGGMDEDDLSPVPREQVDIAASIKALARSVHGDTIFGELPRPRFSTQI